MTKEPKPNWMWENQIPDDRKKVDIESDIVETEATDTRLNDLELDFYKHMVEHHPKPAPTPQTRDTDIERVLKDLPTLPDWKMAYVNDTNMMFAVIAIQSLIDQATKNARKQELEQARETVAKDREIYLKVDDLITMDRDIAVRRVLRGEILDEIDQRLKELENSNNEEDNK